jgi:acyl transferase domain-containing protein
VLGLRPAATIGYSSGESNALFALGAWNDLGAMIQESHEGPLFQTELVGAFDAPRRAWARLGLSGAGWSSYSVAAPLAEVQAALAGEPLCHLTIVNAPGDCVVAGEAQACERLVERLGRARTIPLGYGMAAHCPEVEEVRESWWKLHRREARPVPGVRFYTNATNGPFQPTPEGAADAITGQALHTLDFPRTIERAWADGVRLFVEHGPRGLCSGWIRSILGDREHLTVPLDLVGRSGVRQLLNGAASLVAAGVPVDLPALDRKLSPPALRRRARQGGFLELAAHPPPVRLPALEAQAQPMPPAPWLPPVTGAPARPAAPTAHFAPAAAAALAAAVPAAAAAAVPAAAAAAAPVAAPIPAALPLAAPAASSDAASALVPRLAAHQSRIAALHRDFLAQQAAVHEQFLAARRSAERTLFAAWQGAQAGPVIGLAPVTAEPVAAAAAPATATATAPATATATGVKAGVQVGALGRRHPRLVVSGVVAQ